MMQPITLEKGYFSRLAEGRPLAPGEELKFEILRLKTFSQWNDYDKARPIRLAKAGFIYTGHNTKVQCFVCHLTKHVWNKDMDPLLEHGKLNPECPFVRKVDNINIVVYVPDDDMCKSINNLLHQQYCVSAGHDETNRPQTSNPLTALGRDQIALPNALISVTNVSDNRHYPILANDNASAGTTRQAIGNYSSAHSEADPIAEEFSHYKKEVSRFATFETWPATAKANPRDLARNGFIYTKIADRVQCVFCKGILRNWNEEDDPSEEHREYFPNCPFIQGKNVGNIPDFTITEGNEFINVTSDATLGIVTERPRHPNYAVEAVRLNSFVNWPSSKEQTPEMLAKAGFFYAGIGDSVKCFFCDGGLRTWEPGDDPWREHARWFPRCPYVRQVKGQEFISSASNNASGNVAKNHSENKKNRTPGSKAEKQTMAKGKTNIDPRDVSARMDTPVVRTVLVMGIPRNTVEKTIERHLQETGDDFASAEALLEAVFDYQNRDDSSVNPSNKTNLSTANTSESKETKNSKEENKQSKMEEGVSSEDTESLLEENRQLKEQRQCRICMDAEVNVVFLPCGHLVCCTTCAPAMRKCPICRGNIRGTVRTFLS